MYWLLAESYIQSILHHEKDPIGTQQRVDQGAPQVDPRTRSISSRYIDQHKKSIIDHRHEFLDSLPPFDSLQQQQSSPFSTDMPSIRFFYLKKLQGLLSFSVSDGIDDFMKVVYLGLLRRTTVLAWWSILQQRTITNCATAYISLRLSRNSRLTRALCWSHPRSTVI